MTSLDFNEAATKLFGGAGSKPATTAAAEPTNFRDAATAVYGTSEPSSEPPVTRDDLSGISLFGSPDEWRAEIERAYGPDLPVAQRLAAAGLAADSDDPAAARAAIAQGGVSPARFRELVAIGRRVAGGGR